MLKKLAGLTDEHRQFALETRAKNRSVKATISVFEELYPNVEKYALRTWQEWFAKPEVKAEYKKVEHQVRKQVRNYSYANKDNRLLAYIEVSQKIMESLRVMEPTEKQFPVLARELRENLKFIREEVDPFNLEDEQTRSAFESFWDKAKGTPWEKHFQSQAHSTQEN